MLKVDTQIRMVITNLNDKLASITSECSKDEAYADYIDEKLKSIEWDIRVLRNRIDKTMKERVEDSGNN